MGRRILSLLLALTAGVGLAACGQAQSPAEGQETASPEAQNSALLITYAPETEGDPVAQAATLLAETLGGDVVEMGQEGDLTPSDYEFVLLGFAAADNALPAAVETFLDTYDFGARTLYPFVLGTGNDEASLLAALSQHQPGALLGEPALLFTPETEEAAITQWAQSLPLRDGGPAPEGGTGNTVATAQVMPHAQQVLYLWEEGNAPAVTEYTVNNGSYSDDPDFRPYLTTFPVPEGTAVKGAVLICPGGAFQFRSDQPEGVAVAQALSARGYQSFVVDYRLRPYTQQEGALDLARAVRFVRAHAEDYGIDPADIAVMGFSAGGILSGEMLLHFDGTVNGTALDPDYVPDALDQVSADGAACGMIYAFTAASAWAPPTWSCCAAAACPPPSTATAPGTPSTGSSWPTPTRRRRRGFPWSGCSWTACPMGLAPRGTGSPPTTSG